MSDTDSVDTLLKAFTQLKIQHEREIKTITREHNQQELQLVERIAKSRDKTIQTTRKELTTSPHQGASKKELAVGDTVTLLSTTKIGRKGDRAIVRQLGQIYVSVILTSGNNAEQTTKRIRSNLKWFVDKA